MVDALWLTPEKVRLVHLICTSYQRAFGRPLFACDSFEDDSRSFSQEVFAMQQPLLAHDKNNDPLLNYVNSSALLLWHRRWDEMVGMPSRISAPANQLKERRFLLNQASINTSFKTYGGIRVDSLGREFYIRNIYIWTVWDENEIPCGQAATFSSWWFL